MGRLVLVVRSTIYPAIATKLATFQTDLAAAGYTVEVYQLVSGTAEDLRTYLQGLYGHPDGLVGAILIGDIPYIIYEMMQDWDGAGPDPPEYEDFACDLFYMDLNGGWMDALEYGDVHAANGKYDTRTGDLSLEIWVSRMKTDNLTDLGTETAVLNHYFDKDYNYRHKIGRPAAKGLAYVDDDWESLATDDFMDLIGIYGSGNCSVVSSPNSTTAADYKTVRLPTDQELIAVRSHGWPGGHGFYENNKAAFQYVYTPDYRAILPPAPYYSFFVCSGCDFTAANHLGGIATFNSTCGLVSWGPTKTGGMWAQASFYDELSNGGSIGAALKRWLNYVQTYYASYAPRWWYGMVILGDGALRAGPNHPPTVPTVDVTPDSPHVYQDLTVAASGSTDPDGDAVSYNWRWYCDTVHQATHDNQLTVPASATSEGEVWQCVVTPNDGTGDGPSAADQVTIEAAPPPSLEWARGLGYANDGCEPNTGDAGATYTFKVKYTDASGQAPKKARCIVAERVCREWKLYQNLGLTKVSGDIATGAVYSVSVEMPNLIYKHRFLFEASDGTPVTGTPNDYKHLPRITGTPFLCWAEKPGFESDGVHPDSGAIKSRFKYMVLYQDSVGDAPSTRDVVVRRDGATYKAKAMNTYASGNLRLVKYFVTTLWIHDSGSYEYRFRFADVSGDATGDPAAFTAGPGITTGGSTASLGTQVTGMAVVPTRAGAQLTFTLSADAEVAATVLNVAGRPIRTICADRPLGAGLQTLIWDRRSDAGLPAPAGLYLIRVTARDADGVRSSAMATTALR